jgi:hypothetical protein
MSSVERKVVFSTYHRNQNNHAGDLVQHSGLFFGTVAYSRYDVPSKMFYTDHTDMFKSIRRSCFVTIMWFNICIIIIHSIFHF